MTANAGNRRRGSPVLVGSALALAVLFVIAPASLAGGTYGRGFTDNAPLVDATRASLDYWFRYHVAKASIAALLLAVLIVLGVRVWRSLAGSDGPGRGGTAALASACIGITVLAVSAMALVMANIQGAIAPFSSLLSLLGAWASRWRSGRYG
jgi:hypothetical protein